VVGCFLHLRKSGSITSRPLGREMPHSGESLARPPVHGCKDKAEGCPTSNANTSTRFIDD